MHLFYILSNLYNNHKGKKWLTEFYLFYFYSRRYWDPSYYTVYVLSSLPGKNIARQQKEVFLTNFFVHKRWSKTNIASRRALGVVTQEQRNALGKVSILSHTSASAVLGPLVAPEVLVGVATFTSRPVLLHVAHGSRGQLRGRKLLISAICTGRLWTRP